MDTQKMHMSHGDIVDDIIYERNREITKIAREMTDVNTLMKTISEYIYQQSDQVDTIASNITIAGENCKDAVKSIEYANEEDKKNIKNTMIWIGVGVASSITIVGAIVGSIILL